MHGTPLLIGGSAVERMRAVASGRAGPARNGPYWHADAALDYEVEDGVAVLTIDGAHAFDCGVLDAFFGVIPTGLIVDVCERLAVDASVRAVVVECNSPGGTVAGQDDLQRAFDALAESKPVYTIVHECCCSGLYRMLCSSAELVTTETGEGGCIGSGLILTDSSGHDEKYGIRTIPISDMADKFVGAPGTAVDEHALEVLHAWIDPDSRRFRERVAEQRGLEASAIAEMAGRTFIGPELVAMGLADRVVGFDAYIQEIRARHAGEENTMSILKPGNRKQKAGQKAGAAGAATNQDRKPETVDELKEMYPELTDQLMAEAAENMEEDVEQEDKENAEEEETEAENMEKDKENAEEEEKKGENAAAAGSGATNSGAASSGGASSGAATFAELDAAIPADTPGREKVINDAQREGLSVVAALGRAVTASNEAARNAMRVAGVARDAGGADPVSTTGGNAKPGTYGEAVEQVMREKECARHEAVKIVNERFPQLRKQMAGR